MYRVENRRKTSLNRERAKSMKGERKGKREECTQTDVSRVKVRGAID